MATTPSDSSPVDPAELGRREFTKLRKGWDPVEVRAHLLRMADEIARLQRSEAELRSQVARHEAASAKSAELDESMLTQMLGEETARVLEAARTASSEIRTKAEDNAARLVREAQEQAARVTREADELRQAAVTEADDLVGSARQRVEELLSEAREAAQQERSDAEAEATTTRERAERAAAEARAEAEADAERVRNAAAQTKTEAEAAAERIRAEATDAAHERAEEATRAAEAEVERAREQGRSMVQEAKEARERMLRDLAERRKVARQQLEALRAGRERLLEAFRSVRGAFDEATDELVESLPAARAAADEAARGVDGDIDAAVAELDAEIGGVLVSPADELAAAPAIAVAPTGRESSTDEASSRLRLVQDAGGDDEDDDSDEDEDDEDDESLDAAAIGDAEGAESQIGSVEELFARLRADQDDAPEPDEVDESADSDNEDAVVIALESERGEIAEVVELPRELDAPTAAATEVLDRRDHRLANAERNLTRRLKRALSDQENAVLHSVRSDRKAKTVDAVLGDAAERAAAVVDAAVAELIAAVDAGAGLYDDDDHRIAVDAEAIAAGLGPAVRDWIAEPLRVRLERAAGEADLGGDRSELVERVRAAYRELRNERLPELVGDLLTAACNEGVLAASRPGTSHNWLVDHGGLPCPDGEDNHLAGAVIAGEAFPTGDLRPPAQPGCRCLLVPADR
ncbi:MAG: DivIVA domain-containing protein [Microthrixaceae bacterium]|nr:DivIVA domain-containing protein [Microthrixaceae bacterium]